MEIIKRIWFLAFLLLAIESCQLKSKTDLYLERGLDILNNTKKVEFFLNDSITVMKIGVINDEKEKKKTLAFMLKPNVSDETMKKYSIGIKAELRKDNSKVEMQWDFNPTLIKIKNFIYVLTPIKTNENKISKMVVYLYNRNKYNGVIGKKLIIKNLYTNND